MLNKSNYPVEMKLWVTVVTLSIQDYIKGLMTGSHTIEFDSAKNWIYAYNQKPKNSFDNICLLCNMNPDAIRQKINTDTEAIYNRMTHKLDKEEPCTEKKLSTEILD
jgi:hypothetical protein